MQSCGGFTVGLLWDCCGFAMGLLWVILRRSHSIDLSAGQTHLTAVAQVLVVSVQYSGLRVVVSLRQIYLSVTNLVLYS